MASRNRSTTAVAPGAPAKLQPRKGKDGFVADNVFAIVFELNNSFVCHN